MIPPPYDWLPAAPRSEDFACWADYEAAIFALFQQDYVEGPPVFVGQTFYVREGPPIEGRHATFWHLITEGEGLERLRKLCPERCECIRWARAMLGKLGTDDVRVWRTRRAGIGERLLIALPDFSYVVVLAIRPGYVHLVTAYAIKYKRQRQQKEEEWRAYQAEKANARK